jgi:hypothetical protein
MMNIREIKEKLQAHIAIHGVPKVKQDEEPDMMSYAHEVMADEEFKTEYDEFLASIRGEQYEKAIDNMFGNPLKQIDDMYVKKGE